MFARKTAPLALALALALVLATSGAAEAESPPAILLPSAPIVGGWSELGADQADLRAVARYVVPRLPRKRARLLKIEGGEQQVVAGTNYRIVLQLTDRTRWRAQVWRKLDGRYELTKVTQIK